MAFGRPRKPPPRGDFVAGTARQPCGLAGERTSRVCPTDFPAHSARRRPYAARFRPPGASCGGGRETLRDTKGHENTRHEQVRHDAEREDVPHAAERPRPRVLEGERQIAHERGRAGDRRVFPCRSPPMVRRVASCSVFVFFRVAKRFRVSRPNGSGGCGDAAARRRRPPGLNASRGGSQSARRGLQPQSTAHRRGGGAARSGANFRGSARRARPLRPLTHGFNRQARVFYPTWKIRDKGPLGCDSKPFP